MKSATFAFLAVTAALAQSVRDAPYTATPADLDAIRGKAAELRSKLGMLRVADDLKADVEIYAKAGEWIVRFPEEFYTKAYRDHALAVLERGMFRADQLVKGESPWAKQTGRLARAYRSRVDGSVQPYGLVIPPSYDGTKPVRLDVVLHGRAGTMNEASFLAAHDANKAIPPEQDFIQLEVYGRTNNAYRWAGETDVFEALASVQKRYNIDPQRIVLRGFSMGGAGAWHIGLHHPDQWAAMEAGAGFAETKTYAKLANPPAYVDAPLHIYDAVDYAANARNLPVVGYGGEIDPQLRASQLVQKALDGMPNLRALFLVGPQTEHKWHPESLKQSDAFIRKAVEDGRREPEQIHFVTYTTRYNRCWWLTIDALGRHYERAEVDGTRDKLVTRNVAALTLDRPSKPVLDGQAMRVSARSFVNVNGKWKAGEMRDLRKRHGLQGPIDDAFMDAFIAVGNVPEQIKTDWAKWMRGDLPLRESPTKEDIATKHLILFGDPQTNPTIKQINSKLPIRWEGSEIIAGSRRFPAAEHRLVLIYPNPLNRSRYVVLNSTYTFGEKEFKGTNALLYPHLGDWAIIRTADGSIAAAGLFEDDWTLAATL